jgi:hypothetical protein
MSLTPGTAGLESARLRRAGERLQTFADFSLEQLLSTRPNRRGKFVAAERRNQHAERVRSPERSLRAL